MIPAIITRVSEAVPALQGRVYGAAALAALMKADSVPTLTPCVHVLPIGIAGAPRAGTAASAYRQMIERQFALILSLRTHDPNGAQVLDEAGDLIDRLAAALCGWTPANTSGVFALQRVVLASFARGVAIYELDFSLPDQLRISP